jgi:hypothetical protein
MGASNGSQIHPLPLPSTKGESTKYVCVINYQIPRRILLGGRSKVSPRYETMYGLMYWLNQQNYNLDYTILMTTKEIVLRQGTKKAGEKVL